MRAAELHRLARTLREIALQATENTGTDRVNAGELAVLEDIARHPGSTIRDVTDRTGLAQSLVSRIVRGAAEVGALTIEADAADRRRVRVELAPRVRQDIRARADNTIDGSIAAHTPVLTPAERRTLVRHLSEASELLRKGSDSERT